MIHGCTNPSTNERTFLAWVRTGIAVPAFGFLTAILNLLLPMPALASAPEPGGRLPMDELVWPVGQDAGLALAGLGMAVVIIASVRLVRIRSLLDDTEEDRSTPAQFGVAFSAVVALVMATACVYWALA